MSDLSNSDADCLVVGNASAVFGIQPGNIAAQKLTVKPLRYIPLQEQFDIFH